MFLWAPVWLLLVFSQRTLCEDICLRCGCLPLGSSPTQAICHSGSPDEEFIPATTENSNSLELIYIYGIKMVNFTENAITTENPVTILIQNCSDVSISDHAVARLRTLLIRDVSAVELGVLPWQDLWAIVLEDIHRLTVQLASLSANYSVSIGHIGLLTLEPSDEDATCSGNTDASFALFDTKVKAILARGMSVCGGHVTISNNTFEDVAEEGFQLTTEGSITIIYNKFENVSKQAFNLTSPVIHIANNKFNVLPAGALRDVSTIQDTFFINNTVDDVDLGGLLLDMGWDMIIEHNIVECDCASKRTSILNPKKDMLYLSNSSLEKLQIIFLNNYCNLECNVTLRAFSYALILGDVCMTNDTVLEQEKLCNISVTTDLVMTTENTTFSTATTNRVEFLVPLSIIVVTILLTSSVCYGCKEMYSFRFKFTPNREAGNKIPLQ